MDNVQKEVEIEEVSSVNSVSTTNTTSITNTTSTTSTTNDIKTDIKENDSLDMFVTEDDTFDVTISYYKINNIMTVESVDDIFDTTQNVKTITVTFKYPSHGDYEAVVSRNINRTPDKMSYVDVIQMELTRLIILIRKWSIKADFSRLPELDPKIIKAMTNKVRDQIGLNGIL